MGMDKKESTIYLIGQAMRTHQVAAAAGVNG